MPDAGGALVESSLLDCSSPIITPVEQARRYEITGTIPTSWKRRATPGVIAAPAIPAEMPDAGGALVELSLLDCSSPIITPVEQARRYEITGAIPTSW
ncbi:hypothetical protein C9412_14880 [Stenotrophomonas sp. Nf1]|nr:hypothetical protein C9412_14880 [Stenotrophomonas sp. Nf1]